MTRYPQRPRIKICCISNLKEAQLAIAAGASAVGLVGKMPSGPGVISDEQIRSIASQVPPPVATFLLTSETKAKNIIAHHRRVHTSVIQLVDAVPGDEIGKVRDTLPGIKLVQVIHVNGENSIDEALAAAPRVDAILLDSGNPGAAIKELGGTGRVHNWEISRRICQLVERPVFLAGGLNPQNVRQAWETVQPFGIDVCSSVRSNGHLDAEKLKRFMAALEIKNERN